MVGERKPPALSNDGPQDAIDESSCATFPDDLRELHALVNDGRHGHAVEVQELIRGEPQDIEHLVVQPRDIPS